MSGIQIDHVPYDPITSEYGQSGRMVNVSAVPSSSLPDVANKWTIEPCFLNERYQKIGDKILDFNVRTDDVWVVSYPKTGTTWTQEMIWLIANDLDYKGARSVRLGDRYTFLEVESIYADLPPSVSKAEAAASPRFIKSHLPAPLLPRQLWTVQPRLVYVVRNPKDTAISYYHHMRCLQGSRATFEQHMNGFLRDQILFSPFHSHCKSFWNCRQEPFVHFVQYEDMKSNMGKVLRGLVGFFEKSFSDEQLDGLEAHLSFDVMKENESANYEGAAKRSRERFGDDFPNHDFK